MDHRVFERAQETFEDIELTDFIPLTTKELEKLKHTLTFKCLDCKTIFDYPDDEDPTTGSGCCKACGSSHWTISNMKGERII